MFFDRFKHLRSLLLHSLTGFVLCTPVFSDASSLDSQTSERPPSVVEVVEVTTTAIRLPQTLDQQGGNLSIVSQERLAHVDLTHINEAFFQVPGGWISRGNGQEHLTALRSPVFTGAGACGEFLMAEDLIPLRAAGFCNANQLFDANSEQAGRIEVIRGPGSALYGSNALHGVINIISRAPAERPETDLSVESGPHDYARLKVSSSQISGNHYLRFSANTTHDGGYKDHSGFDQQKITLRHDYRSDTLIIENGLTVSNLNQETAGFIQGHEAYKDNDRKTANPNPEAFRDSRSARLYSRWQWSEQDRVRYVVTPYIRWADMSFLQHFVPWQPLEENGQFSVGVQTGLYLTPWRDKLDLITGIDVEFTRGWLKESQSQAFSPTLPQGTHYDYQVDASVIAPYAQLAWRLGDNTTVTAGLRAEHTVYDYDNRENAGDACAAGVQNCRFFRPADRSDNFTAWSPKLGILHHLNEQQSVYLNVLQSYRAPQATELYRLQNGQQVADLDIEQLHSIELGYRGTIETTRFSAALFSMQKEHFIFQDTERQTISDGESEHQGIELELTQPITTNLTARLSGSYARHRYSNDTAISQLAIGGNDIDTAPRRIGQLSLEWRYRPNALATVEAIELGRYYLNPENTETYAGHTLVNVRVSHPLSRRWALGLRITNLTDSDYAERADVGFGAERYFVGEPRSVYMSIKGYFSG